ncbi:MAG: NAD(P)/FAD-dependent oxidoreductase [Gemmatimonadota bacterium]
MNTKKQPHVVILGGGFGGLHAARALARAPVRITLVDRHNYHLFQPLLYQVATASLSPADIATPIRHILRRQENVEVWLGEAEEVDVDRRIVRLDDGELSYDYLVVATGATHAYFGNDEWAEHAPGLKTVDDALEIRRRFLLAFEAAEREADPEARRRQLTYAIVGAGPTGVELAGAMAEIARRVIPRDFRFVDTRAARIVLLEGGPRVLPTYPPELSEKAEAQLRGLGVEVRTDSMVTRIEPGELWIGDGEERIAAENVYWAAGVAASPLGESLGAPLDRAGRVHVRQDCTIDGHPEVFVIGDLARFEREDGDVVPGVAPAAIQMGRYAGRAIRHDVRKGGRSRLDGPVGADPLADPWIAGSDPDATPGARAASDDSADTGGDRRPYVGFEPFQYRDKGDLATIGRAAAVARITAFRFSGFLAWLLWVFVHILYLIGFRNRLMVMIQWAWAWVTYQRGIRLITGHPKFRLRRARAAGYEAGIR